MVLSPLLYGLYITMPMIRLFVVFIASLCLTPVIWAAPPFFTDDPDAVAYGHHEVYLSSALTRVDGGSWGNAPMIEYDGGWAPDIQFHALVPLAFVQPDEGDRLVGLGDTELGIKYRIADETATKPMIGVFPKLIVPTGDPDKGLGNGTLQYFVPVWILKRWGDWQSYGGGGYWVNHSPDMLSFWFFGWQIQRRLNDHLTLGVELYRSTAQMVDQGDSSGFNIGGYYHFNEHHHLLFSAGQGLQNVSAVNQFSAYLGYKYAW